jgi:hypothetical protein
MVAAASGCSDDPDDSEAATTTNSEADTTTTTLVSTDLLGSWHRAQTCQEMAAAFETAGLGARAYRAQVDSPGVCVESLHSATAAA